MSFALNTGRFIGSAAASIVHGTGLATTQLSIGAKEGYATRAQEFAAKRAALGLSNTAPVEAAPAAVITPVTRRRAGAR
jgi:hypothetical protein